MSLYTDTIKALVKKFPDVVPHLKGRARWVVCTHRIPVVSRRILLVIDGEKAGNYLGAKEIYDVYFGYKTYDYYLQQVEHLVRSVYAGNLGGEFIDIMANLISGQLNQAFEQAWNDEGTEGDMPDYLTNAAEDMILNQYDYVDQFYRDIVDARIDKTPIEPLLVRASLWAQRWTEAYNNGVSMIHAENGDKEIWVLGETEQHCSTCGALNGIVAYASEWDELGVRPQNAPNDVLECGGWQCDCRREKTDKRRSPKAFETIMNIVNK